ncbi:Carbonic anhydrase 6 [Halotydeus destructor]|nr:Carbonic anhydrase 6 [Halotydeus destructor]
MKQCVTAILLGIFITFDSKLVDCQQFKYKGPFGPPFWSQFEKGCAGQAQSPINIQSNIVSNPNLELVLENFDNQLNGLKFINRLYKVEADVDEPAAQTVTGSAVGNQIYRLIQFHVHWGPNDYSGTEHAFRGRRYAMELHAVWANDKYLAETDAATVRRRTFSQRDGLVVLAVLFRSVLKNTAYLSNFFRGANRVKCNGQSTIVDLGQSLMSLFPKNLGHFYRYHGSLTTPPCAETVTWIVFRDLMPIAKWQARRALIPELCDLLKVYYHYFLFSFNYIVIV